MPRVKQPGVKVLFVGKSGFEHHIAGVGDFMASPVTVPQVVERIVETVSGQHRHRRSRLTHGGAGRLGLRSITPGR
jgi:hypothetical protein